MDYYVDFDQDGNITGYYTPELHADIPKKCIKITEEEWKYLVINQVEYCVDVTSGNIVWCGKRIDEKAELEGVRSQRNNLLSETDWIMQRHTEQKTLGIETAITDEQYSQLAVYRQKLRDLPSKINLRKPIWPTKPF